MVKMVGSIMRAPLKLLGMIPKTPKLPAAQPTVTRDDARDRAGLEEELRKRRGGAADMMTGDGGAEAGSGGKTKLG